MTGAMPKGTGQPPDDGAAVPGSPGPTAATMTMAPVPSAALLRGQKSVAIEHEGSVYRLQLTKLGKLILTK